MTFGRMLKLKLHVRIPGKVHLCLDLSKIKAKTIPDAYPLPETKAILSRLPKARFITKLDVNDAFGKFRWNKSRASIQLSPFLAEH